MKNCENCGIGHNGEYGSGRFCSTKCSRGFSTKYKRLEINDKVSKTMKKENPEFVQKECKNSDCKKIFDTEWKNRHKVFCSRSCVIKNQWKDLEYRKYMANLASVNAIKRHENPNVKFGWKKRTKFKMSYPEKIANEVLKKSGLVYEYEHPVHPFFIDFALIEHKIAIEIDGRQHDLPERIESDIRKDERLKELGWKVFRIKWPNENIKDSVNKILAGIPSA